MAAPGPAAGRQGRRRWAVWRRPALRQGLLISTVAPRVAGPAPGPRRAPESPGGPPVGGGGRPAPRRWRAATTGGARVRRARHVSPGPYLPARAHPPPPSPAPSLPPARELNQVTIIKKDVKPFDVKSTVVCRDNTWVGARRRAAALARPPARPRLPASPPARPPAVAWGPGRSSLAQRRAPPRPPLPLALPTPKQPAHLGQQQVGGRVPLEQPLVAGVGPQRHQAAAPRLPRLCAHHQGVRPYGQLGHPRADQPRPLKMR
jgi:hypothetical protein